MKAWFDGACWPNQGQGGHGGYGLLVKQRGQTLLEESVYLGKSAHINGEISEYAGVIAAFHFFLGRGISSATIYGDNQMVIDQLNGVAKARRGLYLPYYHDAALLRLTLPDVDLKWVPRSNNKEADRLAKKSIQT